MLLLPPREVHRVRHLFGGGHLALVIDAVIAGNSPAQVWVDNLMTPRTALAWDGAHSVYLVGDPGNGTKCREILKRQVAPAGRSIVKLNATDAAASGLFTGKSLQSRERVLYSCEGPPATRWRQRIPGGYRVSAIHDQFLRLRKLGNFAAVTAEVESCWNSMADFRRAGFGFCAHNAATIVCWCTAEYVSDAKCGIGIETVAAHRHRGFATLTASAFIEHCADRGVIPHWDAWSDNLPSVAVAEKLGFRKIETYSVFVVSCGEAGA